MEVETVLENQPSTSSTNTNAEVRLGLCEVCATNNAKYTCPKCEVKTCSLKCNKIHKLEVECDGQRDRAKFIPLKKFTNLDLSSDYRLLEEIGRNIEASRKKFGKRDQKYEIPVHLFKLRNAAKMRKTDLKFLPYKFARRKNNSSILNFKSNTIFWHIDWIFVNADNLKVSERRVPETQKLSAALNKYFTNIEDNKVLQDKLQFYQAAGLAGVKIFLKAEQKCGKKFYELDPTLSLKECLQKKLIIEYPTIHVVFKDHGLAYDVIDSDDEDMVLDKAKTGNDVVNSIINSAENEDNLYKSLKNLLFISEYSDEELSD